MSMKQEDYLKMIDDLVQNMPNSTRLNLTHTRWLAEWEGMLDFLEENLGSIDEIVMKGFIRKSEAPINVSKEEARHWSWRLLKEAIKRDGVVLLRDWVKRKIRFKAAKARVPVVVISQKDTKCFPEEDVFYFGNSRTRSNYIWKDEKMDNGQRFNKGNKRCHIWGFCREYCDKGFQSLKNLNKYVSDKTKQDEHVSGDDMKAFLPIISRFSDVPLKELKSEYIIFKDGEGIEVKMIP